MRDAYSRFAGSIQSARSLTWARLALPAALVLGLLGAMSAAPAQGAVTHVFQSSFELPEENLRAMAVDETTNSVYLLTASPPRLKKFNAAGAPSNFSATGSNTIVLGTAPRTVAVDNSGGVNNGVIYIGNDQNYAWVYTPAGLLAAQHKRGSLSETFPNNTGNYCGVAVDDSGSWLISHNSGFIVTPYIDKFRPGLWIGNASPQQTWPVSGTMYGLPSNTCKLAVDTENSIYSSNGSVTGTGQVRKFAASVFSLEKPPSKVIDTGSTAFAVDTSTNDLYSDRNSSLARFDSQGVLRESFATGEFEQSAGIAVNSNDSTVYAAIRRAGGVAKKEVRIYKGVITPDITEVEADGGQTTAELDALIGTAAAGNVTDCKVEYGPTTAYGSTVPCSPDATGTPYSGPQAVAASLAGLSKETTYHYRFTATNANGTNKDIDGTFTTHNVRALQTEEPSEITQSSATLNGSFIGDGDPTTYEFEWGPTSAYGEVAVGGESSAVGPVSVSAPVEALETYLPSGEGTYHYRVVATNSSGTTMGPDVKFNTSPPAVPVISGTEASEITTTGATVSASINPGGGPTLFSVDYGTDSQYGNSTLVSSSIGDDETAHPVTSPLEDLQPGTTYHYRVVAVNFGGTAHGPDRTFTTTSLPGPEVPVTPVPPVQPTPGPIPPAGETRPKKCKKGFVKRKGKCVKKKRKKKKQQRNNKIGRGADQ